MQVWLAINNLLVDPACRSKLAHHFGSSCGTERLLRLRCAMTDLLLDQLPVLKDLRRVLDELAMGCALPVERTAASSLIIEQASPKRPLSKFNSIASFLWLAHVIRDLYVATLLWERLVFVHLQVPRMRCDLLHGQDWQAIAQEQKLTLFSQEANALTQQHMQSLLTNIDAMCDLHLDNTDDKVCLLVSERALLLQFALASTFHVLFNMSVCSFNAGK